MAPFVLLVTGESGKQHGYSDEWTDEGLFLYTGEGQRGDMKFVGGNRAIRDHASEGKSLHVFEQDKKDKRFLRYLGEMEYVSHVLRQMPDTDGNSRQAIVFQLRPVGTLSPDSAVVAAALALEVSPVDRRGGDLGLWRPIARRRGPRSSSSSAATNKMVGWSHLLKLRKSGMTCGVKRKAQLNT